MCSATRSTGKTSMFGRVLKKKNYIIHENKRLIYTNSSIFFQIPRTSFWRNIFYKEKKIEMSNIFYKCSGYYDTIEIIRKFKNFSPQFSMEIHRHRAIEYIWHLNFGALASIGRDSGHVHTPPCDAAHLGSSTPTLAHTRLAFVPLSSSPLPTGASACLQL